MSLNHETAAFGTYLTTASRSYRVRLEKTCGFFRLCRKKPEAYLLAPAARMTRKQKPRRETVRGGVIFSKTISRRALAHGFATNPAASAVRLIATARF